MGDHAPQLRMAPGLIHDRRFLLAAALLVIATIAAYSPIVDNGFVLYDDGLYILEVPQVRRGLSAQSVAWAFTTFHGANWFPLTWVSWMADADLYGLDAQGFHATSLALHVLATLILFYVFASMTGELWASAFVAAVFALHPLHVESVAWASARKDVLSGIFWMIALYAHCKVSDCDSRESGARGPRTFLALVLVLGLMAKSTLVVLPFVLLLLDGWPLGRLERIGFAAAVREKLPLFAIIAAAAGWTYAAQRSWGAIQPLEIIPLAARLENAVVAYVGYFAKAFWPTGLAVYYPHPLDSLPAWRVAAAVGFLGVASIAAWLGRRRAPYLAVGWFWFAGALVPVIGIIQVGQAALADRYTYLPLIGISIALAFAGGRFAARSRAAAIAVATAGVLAACAMGVATFAQVRVWKDTTTLFEHAKQVTERNHVAHINLGVVHVNAQRWKEAEVELRAALQIAPRSAKAHGVLADSLRGQSRFRLALRRYRTALQREPDSARWLTGVGNTLLDLDRPDEAINAYRRALERGDSAVLQMNLGIALLEAGDRSGAIESFERAIELRPKLAIARGNFGIALLQDGQIDAAIEQFERALEIDPGLSLVRAHSAIAFSERDGPAAGLVHIREAIRLEPANGELHAIAARMLTAAGRPRQAIAYYRDAIERGDRSVDTLNNIAWLLATATKESDPARSEAVALAEEAVAGSGGRSAAVMDTLARAYAAMSRWEDAADAAESAADFAQKTGKPALAAEFRARSTGYRERALR